MSHQLTFSSVYNYGTEAVIVPVELQLADKSVRTDAYIDTGRRGWLEQVQLGLVEYESTLYLNRYGS